jgi:hypothetical protein
MIIIIIPTAKTTTLQTNVTVSESNDILYNLINHSFINYYFTVFIFLITAIN